MNHPGWQPVGMTIAAAGGPRLTIVGARAALGLAAVVLAAAGVWFAASWIDTGGDDTCGAVIYPGMWLDDSVRGSCQGVMALRAGISVVAVATAGSVGYLGARRRTITRAAASAIFLSALAASVIMTLINEAVRSDGAL